jgi:hypothetical protein
MARGHEKTGLGGFLSRPRETIKREIFPIWRKKREKAENYAHFPNKKV